MAKELSAAEYQRHQQTPKRRYETFAVEDDGAALRQPFTGPCYWFEKNEVAVEAETGKIWRDPSQATVSLVVDGRQSVFFYLVGRRLDTCTFAYDLSPAALRKAVTAMRRSKLQRYIRPAAEWALRHMPSSTPAYEKALQALLIASSAHKKRPTMMSSRRSSSSESS